MNLIEANRIAYSLVANHLPGMGWRIDWSNSTTTAGKCKYGTRTLQFSSPITREVDEDEFVDTVLHEIAHALTPGHRHDHVWAAKHKALGGSGLRTWGSPDGSIEAKLSKWKVECGDRCGFVTYRARITAPVRLRGYCPKCNNKGTRLIITANR